MATTKIWDIKGRVDTLINYAANPEKTDGKLYSQKQLQALHDVMDYASDDYKTEQSLFVSGVNVTPDTAKQKMYQTKLRYGKLDGIVAFHAIQSFKPGEVTPELAHKIGKRLAKEMWGDRFEIVIATHLNKEHLHNHFVINSVSFLDGKKYYDNTANYNKMKQISDRLCEEYNLSVIRNPKHKGMHYAEWYVEKNGYPTIRGQIRDEIDSIIECSYTTQSFWKELKRRGYEVKNTGKYIALKPTCAQKYVRLDKLGKYYTPDAINERIIAARNGIQLLDINKPKPDYNAWLEKYEPIKLKGFKALYYHYLYLFGRIRKKKIPQRVSFYMREEIIKFERYQKQFHFLYDNDIKTSSQLLEIKHKSEDRISELTSERSRLYHKPDTNGEIADINTELKELRAKVRMCNNILIDSERINEKYNEAQRLEQEAELEYSRKNKPKIKTNVLVLKTGHDFPSDVIEGMDYDTFTRRVLNKIGNLRIYYKDKNSGRQNSTISLKEYSNFTTYNNIVEREKDIINILIDECLPKPDVDLSNIQIGNHKKAEASLPKMDKLIEFGIISPGDKIYITATQKDSTAILLDEKYVNYNGEKLTINEWGCKITGWQSIRIYSYVAKVGEIETLHEKRLKFIQNNNEVPN